MIGPMWTEPYEEVAAGLLGPVMSEGFDALPTGQTGPIMSEGFDAMPTGQDGPLNSEVYDAFGNGLGPLTPEVYAALLPSMGPVLTGETYRGDVPPLPRALGPALTHELFLGNAGVPGTVLGPLLTGETFEGVSGIVIIPVGPVSPPLPPPAPDDTPDEIEPSPFPPELSNKPRTNRLQPPRNRDPRAFLARAGRYSGPAFPFGTTPQAVFGVKDDVLIIATSIVNILSTPKESMAYDPSIGSQVPYLLFEPLDDITVMLIRQFAAKEVAEQEPRVNVVSVETDVPNDGDDLTVVISVGFQIVGDPFGRSFNVPVDLPRMLA